MTFFPLLQVPFQFEQANSRTIIIVIAIFVVFIGFLVISGRNASARRGGGSEKSTPGKFTKGNFRKRAKALGLNPEQTKSLENLIYKYQISTPMQLLANSSLLDTTLKKAMREIAESGSSDSIKEAHTLTLYRIKQNIERNSQSKKIVSTSHQIPVGQVVAITPESGGRFQSKITANLKGSLAAAVPVDKNGTQIRWRRGSMVTLFFWKQNGQGYSFQSKINAYSDVRGYPSILVKHSNSVQQAQQRRYRRKQLEKPSYFYPVRIMATGTGKNQTKKAFIETKNHALGTVLEISAGGCSIKTTYPLGKGELIKVEFETSKKSQIAAFGKVVSMSRIKPLGGIMHIMFTRVSQAHLNRINAYVYDLASER